MWIIKQIFRFLCRLAKGLLLLSVTGIAHALDEPTDYISGKVSVDPLVDVRVVYDDNIYLHETAPQSSVVSEINSQLKMTLDNHINLTTFGYSGNYSYYQSSAEDSAMNHLLFAKLHHEILRNLMFDFGAGYQLASEKRGAFYNVGSGSSLTEPDRFSVQQINGLFILGTRQSKGQIEIAGLQKRISFSTRPNVTANRNYLMNEGRATFIRHISPKTSLALDGTYAMNDYVSETEGTESRDSVDQSYLLGMRWEYSKLSRGDASLGVRIRRFDSSSRANAMTFNWRLAFSWAPTRSWEFDAKSGVRFDESAGNSDYILTRDAGIAARYFVSERHTISASATGAYKTYPPLTDSDYVITAGITTDYQLSKWLGMGAAYTQARQVSSRSGFTYTNDSIYVHISVTM